MNVSGDIFPVSVRELINDHIKQQLILLAREHRQNCIGDGCSVCLFTLVSLAENNGISFTEAETSEFLE